MLERELADAMLAAGLAEPWRGGEPRPLGPGTGRGPRALVRLANGVTVLVKQCLRGGALARLNRERYASVRRFERDLRVARRAAERGLPVAPWVGLAWRPARPGINAWLVTPYVASGVDLARRLSALDDPAAARALWRAGLDAVRAMHAGGLYHRDLNLGNLVAAEEAGRRWVVTVVDLDRPIEYAGPVPAWRQRRALRRLERSLLKITGFSL